MDRSPSSGNSQPACKIGSAPKIGASWICIVRRFIRTSRIHQGASGSREAQKGCLLGYINYSPQTWQMHSHSWYAFKHRRRDQHRRMVREFGRSLSQVLPHISVSRRKPETSGFQIWLSITFPRFLSSSPKVPYRIPIIKQHMQTGNIGTLLIESVCEYIRSSLESSEKRATSLNVFTVKNPVGGQRGEHLAYHVL